MLLYYDIAAYLRWDLDDNLVDAIEAACITREEWLESREACVQRVHAAMEELNSGR